LPKLLAQVLKQSDEAIAGAEAILVVLRSEEARVLALQKP